MDINNYNKNEYDGIGGREVDDRTLNYILNHYYLCYHSVKRLDERRNLVARFPNGHLDKWSTIKNINLDIRKNLLIAYFNTDGSVNVAIDEYNYYVFTPQDDIEERKGMWALLTFKEKSHNNINIWEKRELAMTGYHRNEYY